MNKDLRKVFESIGKQMIATMKRELRINKQHASGRIERSLEAQITDSSLEIVANAPYAEILNSGTKKKGKLRPSIDSIVAWMKYKRISPYKKLPNNSVKFVKHSKANYRRAAFLISRSIAENGVSKRFGYGGSNYIESAYKSLEKRIDGEVLEAYKNYVNKELQMVIEQYKNINSK